MKQVIAKVISSHEVMPGAYLIWLEAPSIASEARPGQFVMVNCGEDTLLPRPLSIHHRDGDKIALLSRVAGKGTQRLSEQKNGDSINLFGPLGNGFSLSPDSKNILLVAGGIGIAPLYYLAQEASKRGVSVTLLYGTPDKSRYPLPAEIKEIKATDDGSVGYHGLVTDLIPKHATQADQVFACGPVGMYRAMAQMPELKNKPVQVSLEIGMACGRGICYGCTIKTRQGLRRVCEDGPVFNLDDILWDELNTL
ncbi:dihydroorotate dehydrogenase electron transfer subunit [Chloroflexota bacterium]